MTLGNHNEKRETAFPTHISCTTTIKMKTAFTSDGTRAYENSFWFQTEFRDGYSKINKGLHKAVNLKCFPSCGDGISRDIEGCSSKTFCGNNVVVKVNPTTLPKSFLNYMFAIKIISKEDEECQNAPKVTTREDLIALHEAGLLYLAKNESYTSPPQNEREVSITFSPGSTFGTRGRVKKQTKSCLKSWTLYPKNQPRGCCEHRYRKSKGYCVELYVYEKIDGTDKYGHVYQFESEFFTVKNYLKNLANKIMSAKVKSNLIESLVNGMSSSLNGESNKRPRYHSADDFSTIMGSLKSDKES